MENGKKMLLMEKGLLFMMMENGTRDILKITKKMVKDYIKKQSTEK